MRTLQLLIDGKPVHSSPKVILFDKDGTLIDVHHYWTSMIRLRADHIVDRWFINHNESRKIKDAIIEAMGVDLKTKRMRPDGPVGIKPRQFIVNVAAQQVRNAGCEILDDEMESLFCEVDRITAKYLSPLLDLLPGVKSLLQQLHQYHITSIIVSTDITSRARNAMKDLKLDQYFSAIIGADQVKNTKPAPDLVEFALQNINVERSDAIVIGDHPVDIQMGLAAGVGLNIGVLTGLSSQIAFMEYDCLTVRDLTSISLGYSNVEQ